ncbi:lipase member H-A-like [Macrotis lagotis]|uniref:lipase member H-A-like n=1 Tax=Macrotis lagotis TaxID=92651 RepID=UPI003D699842
MFYTKKTITCAEHLFSRNLILNKKFNRINKTVWIIHGYRPLGSYPVWLEKLTELLLSLEDMNVIIVDWNRGATTLFYQRAVKRTWKVAQILIKYITRMMGLGISLQSFHFIGVSLGAHISGYVGQYFGGQLGRISGIDPAGPAFNYLPAKMRLDHTGAQFVDVIHSDAGGLGISHSIGHIDFYPNGGENQPGCPKTIFSGVTSYVKCSHQRAIFLFISSLSTKCNMTAFPCHSYESFRNGHCTDCEDFGLNLCPISGYFINLWKNDIVKKHSTGLKAYFNTSPKEPFCLFHYSLDIVTIKGIEKKGNIEVKLKDKHGTIETSKIKRKLGPIKKALKDVKLDKSQR